jgi:hypothetical protein
MFIYYLSGLDGEMKYIGKTIDLKKRFKSHLLHSRLKKDTYKNHWIKKLLNDGDCLEIHIIQQLYNEKDLNEAEKYWIKFFKDNGARLTNQTEGGDGRTTNSRNYS